MEALGDNKGCAKEKKICGNCDCYHLYSGACCNGLSEYRADFVDRDWSCEGWEPQEEKVDEKHKDGEHI